MNDPILLGRIVNRKPEYLVDLKPFVGKCIANPLGTNEIWGPFDTPEDAVAWHNSRVKK